MQVTTIVKDLGGVTKVADALGVPVGTVGAWQTRGRIPPRCWPALVNLCKRRRVRHITLEKLLKIHTKPAHRRAK